MSIQAALHHTTHYKYERAITLSPQLVRLRPAPHTRTPIESYSLRISPEPHFINWLQDPHGNFLARVVFPEKVNEFKVQVDLIADMTVINPFDFFLEEWAERIPFTYPDLLKTELAPFLVAPVDTGDLFENYCKTIDLTPRQVIFFLVELNQKLQGDIEYLVRMEPGVQTPEQTLQLRKGSCRDTAWLLINLLRSVGYAARFASGYLIQLTPDVRSLDGPSGTSVDFTDLHAWAEVYIPGAGWIGLDPTSGLLTGEGHIPLACAPSPLSAAPISGVLESCKTEFFFDMKVERVNESPRVTKPYTEKVWKSILQAGQKLDQRMKTLDLHLTMGGEPTFVALDDMEGPEWNSIAVGPDKLKYSQKLMKSLSARYAQGALLHFGQGKWYPGEPLPRWAYSCYWRTDGVPLWNNADLLADIEKDYGYTERDAKALIGALAEKLDVETDCVTPVYEDTWYYLQRERKLPINVDPFDSKLEDPQERARLAAVFERGLDTPKGYILPLKRMRDAAGERYWFSAPWHARQPHFYLIPGDSPIGLRLPLDTLPWESTPPEPVIEQDPSAPLPPLPDATDEAEGGDAKPKTKSKAKRVAKSKEKTSTVDPDLEPVVRTALAVEVRDGKLFVFLPPFTQTEDFIDLIRCLENTAKQLNYKIVVEGECPPPDPRLQYFKITPDPGVIEVNLHPSATWDELVIKTETLYETARETRLCAEKFMIDGRHVGTGGGNHILIGGETPERSPLLRRPDLLRSLVTYWLHHPSLSYLFSGLFIGPTSQSPRIDEARNDSIYELEIACRELDRHEHCSPWLVDRLFRDILIDVSGNKHRAEFCIDKLYNPDRSSGRLGLLELRSYEMPPQARMSLAQQLLIRTLVAYFWEHPHNPPRLKRWGTELHDRFMLPHFVWQDFCEVLQTLRTAGYSIEEEWFRAHFEFRFPKFGSVCYREMELEIRNALEPWHVMGEENSGGGTVRFVDASLERLQVKVTGGDADRYAVLCNGRRAPLTNTGTQGESVAGIRFRAWQPPSCLHPTIPVDAPLTIELVDCWEGRSLGGCTYHVAHPAGRNYETPPVNAYEAEARRHARFQTFGNTPGGTLEIPPLTRSPDFPLTLDMRKFVRP